MLARGPASNAMGPELRARVLSFPMVKLILPAMAFAMVQAGVSTTRAAIVARAASVPATSAMT